MPGGAARRVPGVDAFTEDEELDESPLGQAAGHPHDERQSKLRQHSKAFPLMSHTVATFAGGNIPEKSLSKRFTSVKDVSLEISV